MINMKALHSFVGKEGKIMGGREFTAASDDRADDLVRRGLAARIVVPSPPVIEEPAPQAVRMPRRRRYPLPDDLES